MFIRASLFRAVALALAVCVTTILAPASAQAAGVERVPINAKGQPFGEKLGAPALSHDGRFLVFQSTDSDLTPDDDNGVEDVFVYDYETSELVRASGAFLATFGAGASVHPAISADGRFVAFGSDSNAMNLPIEIDQNTDMIDANLSRDVFVYDRELRQTSVASVQSGGAMLDGASDFPSISGDGRFVVFQSQASTPNEPGGIWRIFAHDRNSGATRVISMDEDGNGVRLDSERPVISADGRYVVFESDAALVRTDTNGRRDIYRYDLVGGRIALVSVSSTGEIAGASSRGASISANGSMVAFESSAGNLVDGDTNLTPDIFVRDLNAGTTYRVSVGSDGAQSDGSSTHAKITADGSIVVFESYALNITENSRPRKPEDAGLSNERSAVFMHSMTQGRTEMIAEGLARATQTRDGDPTISGDGTTMVFNELPLFEPPGGTVGGVAYGSIYRLGSCLNAPEFRIDAVEVDLIPQVIGPMADSIAVNIRPGESLFIRLAADDPQSCDAETMRIRLLAPTGGDPLPDGMTYLKDGNNCGDLGSSPIAVGVLATADNEADDDLELLLCWSPDVDDFFINGGSYQLDFLADFPGSLSPMQVTVSIQVLECDDEIDLLPEFDPGFTSGVPLGFAPGESQFDLNDNGTQDFLSAVSPDGTNLDNRWEEDAGSSVDVDVMTLVPSEEATFDFFFETDINCGSLEQLIVVFPPTEAYAQDSTACMNGSDTSPYPCFLNVDQIQGLSDPSGVIVTVPNPTYPLTKAQFEAQPGWPAGDELRSIQLTITVTPTAADAGSNLVSFQLEDSTGHISDPQVNFVVVPCAEAPCCAIDEYKVEGIDNVVRDIQTEIVTIPGPDGPVTLQCAGVDRILPAGDGVIDVFANQTVSFVVNGRLTVDCPGTMLTIEKDESLGVFPAGVMCVDPDGAGLDYVCFGEEGAPDSDIMMQIEWTPTTGDIRDEVYFLRFRVSDGTNQSDGCLVRVRVCPEPVCSGTLAINGEEPVDLDFSNPLNPPTTTVRPGETLSLHICGDQDCGEFVTGTALDQAIYRTISIQATDATCQLLCDLECVGSNINCDGIMPVCLPETVADDPFIDSDNADGDMDDMTGAEDPFIACLDYTCVIPELDQQSTFELCFDVTDASGKPVQCCVTVIVCPPVTCEPTDILFNGVPADMAFDPMVDTMTITPGMDNLQFKVTAGGGCEGDSVQIDSIEVICLDDMGMPIPLPACENGDACCTLEGSCSYTDIFGAPVTFPFIGTPQNMAMVNVSCSFGADWYELCDKIIVQATVTADFGGPQQQTTSCGVMVDIGPCPNDPTCIVKNEMPELCSLTGDPLDDAIVVSPGDMVAFDVNFLSDCFGAKIKWSATGLPDWLSPQGGSVLPDTLTCPNFSLNYTGMPAMGDEGHYEITFTVMDNTGKVSMCKVWIIVCEGPVCEIREDDPIICTDSGFIEAYPGQTISFDFLTSSTCPIEAFDGRPIIVNWSIKGDVPAGLECVPAPPAPGVFVPLTMGVLTSTCTWTPTSMDVGEYTIVFNTMDNCGRMNECEITVRVCEKPKCLMTVLVNGSPVQYDPNDPESFVQIKPGEDLALELCGMAGSPDCNELPLTITQLTAPIGGPALVCNPALPITGNLDLQGMLCTDCTLLPGPLDVSDTQYVWTFGIEDSCGRVSDDVCALRVLVMPCDPPVCEIQDIQLDGAAYEPGVDPAIIPGQVLTYTIKGTVGCAHEDIGLELDCALPDGATLTPGPLTSMDKVTMRTWDVEWTPLAGEYCNVPVVSFDCTLSVTPPGTADGATSQCNLDVEVGECPAPNCLISEIMIDSGLGFVSFPYTPSSECDMIYSVQPGDVVMFTVTGTSACPPGAENSVTINQTMLPDGATMDPTLPASGGFDQAIVSTFMWTVTDEDCLGPDPMAIFNISQTCGPTSADCKVCFTVGVCEDPPTCELKDFMIQRNPLMCFNPNPDEELPFQDLPFEMVDDGYMVFAMPGDTIKLTFCGKTNCACTSLMLDADGLPEDAIISCDDNGDGEFTPCEFPFMHDPFPIPGEPGFRELCTMVEFVVPPTGTFHISFMVADSDPETADAVCVLWVEVETVCDDFEPNDECELPQEINFEDCGPYLSGLLEERVTPGCRPDTYLVLFNKENLIINSNNNGSVLGDGKADALFDITSANGLSEGNGDDRWLRIGVTGYPDGLVKPFNGYPQNGPHGQLGEFQMTVTFYDISGEIISPAIVQDANGNDVAIDNPFVYTNEFISGAEAFRLNFQAPRAFQGGGVTASASVEIDNSTGLDPLCEDVDFFKYVNLVPMTDYCVTAVGGLSKDCTPIDLQLGWFDKTCALLALDCDSGPSGVAQLCFISDINGEAIIGVTGKGDDDFDGYLVPPAPLLDRAVNGCPDPTTDHGVCGCYTLCIMEFDPHAGALVDRASGGALQEVMYEAMRHGDMNMDGKTDTADLGMLMGRYGWNATDGVTPAIGSGGSKKITPGLTTKVSGAMED